MKQNYSVLMSVYKMEKPEFLKLAIESMLNQTVPTNDFVLVCDGPLTLSLNSVINAMCARHPTLFQVIRLETNCGLGNALNIGLEKCKNELIARMDSDDISLPYRCEKQLRIFQNNSEIALCSSNIAEFESTPNKIKSIRHVPQTHEEILRFAKVRNPMNHMAVMYKRKAVIDSGGYIEIHLAEDYYLWVRMLQKGYKAANLQQCLVYARTGKGMYKRRGGIEYAKSIYELQQKLLQLHFISYLEFIRNCGVRIIVSLIPTWAREYFYQRSLRGTNDSNRKSRSI